MKSAAIVRFLPCSRRWAASLVFCLTGAGLQSQSSEEPPLPIAGERLPPAVGRSAPSSAPKPPIPALGSSPIPMQAPGSVGVPPPLPPTAGQGGSVGDTGFSSKVTTSTGGKGQFIVHGKDLQTRGPFSNRCGDISERLRRLLKDEEPWVLPIVVALKTAPDLVLSDPPVKTSISKITSGGFHLQVTVQIRPDLRPAALDAEITRILIAERILRNHAEITTKRSMVLPDWLLTGVTQAMTFRDRSRPSAVFAAIFRSGKVYSIEEILDAAPGELDALSRTLYETSCCALVLALLDQVEGPMRLQKFLSMLAVDSRDDRELLNFCFPTLALSSSSLNKWWSLQMASLATPTVFETLGPTETQKALTEALTLRYETTAESAPKRSSPAPAEAPVVEETPSEKKPSMLVRLLGSGPDDQEAKKEPDPKKKDAPPAAKPKEKKEEAEAESTSEEKKAGFLGRMFGVSGDAEKESEPTDKSEKTEPKPKKKEAPEEEAPKKAEPPKEEKPKEKKAEPEPESPEEETKPGFLGRMFAPNTASDKEEPKADKKEEKPEPKTKEKEAPKVETPKKSEPPKEEKPKAKPESKKEPSEPKKRGFFGRFLGTEGEAKPEEESSKSTPKKAEDKSASVSPGSVDVTALFVSALPASSRGPMVDTAQIQNLWTAFFTESSLIWSALLPERGTPVILGFGKKKPEEESEKEEPKKAAPKKPEPAKEKEPKPTRKELKEAEEAEKTKKAEKAKKEEAEKEKEKKAEATPPAKTTPSPTKTSPPPSKPKLVSVSVPIEDYNSILKRKDRASILDRNAKALAALAQRGNILFRPLINEYIAVIADLQLAKTKDMSARLAALKTKTAEAYARAKAVEDHLDWYEASETQNYSGTFEDYLRLPEQIQKELPLRDDPISQYLDEVEREISQ